MPSLLYYATHSLRKRPQWGLIALEAIPPGFNSLVDGARGWLLARAGRTGEARALADDLIRDPEAADFPRRLYSRAVTFAALGSPDTAFAALARACEAGYADGFSFDSDQEAWRTVWNDPRYALLEKVVAQAHADKLAGTSASYDSLATLVDAAARRPAPEADLRDSTGARVSLADFRGKIVLLDFWSTWCGWCRTGMPLMSEFAKSLPADRFVVLSVQVQEMDSTGWVRGPEIFRSGHYGMRYTRGTASTQDAFHARGLPTLVILDRTGRVALTHTDYLHDPRAVIGPILDQLRAEHALPRGR